MTVIGIPMRGGNEFGVQILQQLGLEGKTIFSVVVKIRADRSCIVSVREKDAAFRQYKTTISLETAQYILKLCGIENAVSLTIVINSKDPVRIYATCIGRIELSKFDWSVFKEQ